MRRNYESYHSNFLKDFDRTIQVQDKRIERERKGVVVCNRCTQGSFSLVKNPVSFTEWRQTGDNDLLNFFYTSDSELQLSRPSGDEAFNKMEARFYLLCAFLLLQVRRERQTKDLRYKVKRLKLDIENNYVD